MTNPLPQIISLPDAAKLLGLSEKRVLVLIAAGRINAKQLKREYAISLPSVKAFAELPRKPGPRKA